MDLGKQLASLLGDNGYNAALRWQVLASSYPIASVEVDVDLVVTFENGAKLIGQTGESSCCEQLYLTCDDDLAAIAGGRLMALEQGDYENVDTEYGDVHEILFFHVMTTNGSFTIASHNEHNGYYGGVSFNFVWVEPD